MCVRVFCFFSLRLTFNAKLNVNCIPKSPITDRYECIRSDLIVQCNKRCRDENEMKLKVALYNHSHSYNRIATTYEY